MEVKTRNSIYVVDMTNRTVKGGSVLKSERRFVSAEVIPGYPALFVLDDKQIVRTSTVLEVHTA